MGTHLGNSLKHHYTMCMVTPLAPTLYTYNQPFCIRPSTYLYGTSLSVVTAYALPLCHLISQSVNCVNTSKYSTCVPQTDAAIMPCVPRNLITVEISLCHHILSQVTNSLSKPSLTPFTLHTIWARYSNAYSCLYTTY